jgi:vitamin B12 transporter
MAAGTAPATTKTPTVETIVVSGNRLGTPEPRDRIGTATSTLESGQLAERQVRFVADALRDVPGVAVSRSGGAGSLTQVRLRGAEANHTLVLLDGVDVSDPFAGEFDFAGLLAADIERIEVLRGEQSALYGSDAIGGVINLLPRRGGTGPSATLSAEAGSHGTFQRGASAGFGNERVDLFASVHRHHTGGENVARSGRERDGADARAVLVNAGWQALPQLSLRALLRQVDTSADTDPQDFAFPATPTQGLVVDGDTGSVARQRHASLQATLSLLDGRWTTVLAHTFTDVDRRNEDDGVRTFVTSGRRDRTSLVSGVDFAAAGASHRVTAAIDREAESYRNVPTGAAGPEHARRHLDASGYVLALDSKAGSLDLGAALRHDRNDRFRDDTTWRLQASYRLAGSGTRLRAAAGTGSKNPTNFELFGFDPGSFAGNPALRPERSRGLDAGIDQALAGGRVQAGLTWFRATLEDEVFTTFLPGFIASPRNRDSHSHRSGVEATVDASLDDALGGTWTLAGAWTWLRAREAGEDEVRRPAHAGSLQLARSFLGQRGRASIGIRFNGEQEDSEFIDATPATRARLDDFTLVNVALSYAINDALTLQARIENALDERYEEVFSYRAPGRAAYVGLGLDL